MRKLRTFFLFLISLLYLEFLFRLFSVGHFFSDSWIYILLYLGFLSAIFTLFCSFTEKKFPFFFLLGIMTIWYCGEIVFKNSFHVYFSISTIFFADQALSFADKIIEILFSNLLYIFLVSLPFFSCFYIQHRYHPKIKLNCRDFLITACMGFLCYMLFLGFLMNSGNEEYSKKELYFERMNNALNKESFGALPSALIEIRKILFPKREMIYQVVIDENKKEDVLYQENVLEISLEDLLLQETDETIRLMHEYFLQETPTYQNEYTGMLKGKNLIFITAESFHSMAVSKSLTPTLYRLSHEGFVFENFYTPIILSTIGGEFQTLTGLYPNLPMLSNVFRKKENAYPFALGNSFQKLGYQVKAFHNHDYDFQNRNTYFQAVGLSDYMGCGNGLEKKIQCNLFPESDLEMILATLPDSISQEKPFFTYYMTVSGHMSYNFKTNDMAIKNQSFVEYLPYSEEIKAYLATQVELDRALEKLLQILKENRVLDQTVIALVGDHYPYDISEDHLKELILDFDDALEMQHSNFILWNPNFETIKVNKVGGNMDVLPTLLNLFGIPYDSRLIMGKDLLSNSLGLVIFEDHSWISDIGVYHASTKEFSFTGESNDDIDYRKKISRIVSNRVNLSKLILEKNYYEKVLGD